MAKELPKMYQNKVEKKFDNTQRVYSTLYTNDNNMIKAEKKEMKNPNNLYTVEQKIFNIFKSPTYIYKVDVILVVDNQTLEKRIIGKNKNNLITIDNEYIPINKIQDIYLK